MSAIQSGLLRLSVILALLVPVNLVFAQNFQKLYHGIDSLVEIGLPKSALNEVDKLDQLARKEKNVPMQIKAVIYRMTFQSYIEENALVAIITRLKLDIEQASYPVKPVLQSLLANMYYQYCQQKRWQISNRSHIEKPSDDYTKWDLQTIISETSRLYMVSLSEAKREQATPIEILDGVLVGEKNTRYLRPSLYDLLLHRALGFFLADEPALSKPKLAFSVNDNRFFSDSHTFTGLNIKTNDTLSTFYIGLRYLQQATLFHLQNHHDEALADLNIKRMEFLHNKATLENKDSLYSTALKQIASTFSNKPISADAWTALAKYYKDKDSLQLAMQFALKAIAAYPESMGGQNAEVLINEIKQKNLFVKVEDVNIPGVPILAQIQFRNIQKVSYKIYHLSESKYKQYTEAIDEDHSEDTNSKIPQWLPLLLKGTEYRQQIDLQFPDPQDYRNHKTEFKIEALRPGNYLIWIENSQLADSSLIHFTCFKVSQIAYITRINSNEKFEARVMDRKSGEPLNNVFIKLNYKHNRKEITLVKKGFTDETGMFKAKISHWGNYDIQMIYNDDTLSLRPKFWYNYNMRRDKEKAKDKTVLFTDRQIYRPGQTIYFKGLQLKSYKEKSKIVTHKNVFVYFMDVNNKQVSNLKLCSNEFGTFNGSFIIPQNLLNGNVTIRTKYGRISVKVEEYKRNSFQIEFLPVTQSYKLNDSIKIKGVVKSYSGYGLSQASVAYYITRKKVSLNENTYDYDSKSIDPEFVEIIKDTTSTNDKGSFQISFKALHEGKADLNTLVYNYVISADIIDASGETHSANTGINVGNNNIVLNTIIPKEYLVQDTSRIAISINNLNGHAQKGKINVQIFEVQNPNRLFKNRLWGKPDLYLLNPTDFMTAFPHFAYRNEDDFKTWSKGQQISNVTFRVNDSTNSFINLWSLKSKTSGMYKVVVCAQNEKGDSTSITQYVNLIADQPKPYSYNQWVIPVKNVVKPGTEAEFLIGINEPVKVLIEKYKGKQIVDSRWLNISGGLHSIKVPIAKDDKDISIQFLVVNQNRVYTSYQNIQIVKPDKNLDIRLVTFRDKLQPGEKEQWKLQVSAANNQKQVTEMLAAMYDASLDDFAQSQNWVGSLIIPHHNGNTLLDWLTNDFVQVAQSKPLIPNQDIYQQHFHIYENLNMFDYKYFGDFNDSYHKFLKAAQLRLDIALSNKQMEASYEQNALLVKNGVVISGMLVDKSEGIGIPGVSINIKGTNIWTISDLSGKFKIKVPVNGILKFNFIGYTSKEIFVTKADTLNIKLEPSNEFLDEVVVVAYGKRKKFHLNFTPPVIAADSEVEEEEKPLYSFSDPMLDPGLRHSIYSPNNGSDENNLTDIMIRKNLQPIVTRKNFNETAFFYPQLRTNEKGEILIDFTIPEALTKWRFKAFAHTKDLKSGYLEQEIVTQKQLSINANIPRFLREGDTITVSARLVNLNTASLKGNVHIQFFNALNMQPISLLINADDETQSFDLAAVTNKTVAFKLFIHKGLNAITYRLTADAGLFTDGEENTIPVLTNQMMVTESMPMMVRPGQNRIYSLDKLVNQTSTTLNNKSLTLEYTQNPAWYAIQAFPYMMEFPHECSEQIFSRYYANSLATNLVNKFPFLKKVFDQWKNINSPELLSNLEKNQELKATLLEETPWLWDAMNETEQKKSIALLFDLNKMSNELQRNLNKLQKKQLSDGAFPWFGGDYPDRFITQHVLAGIGQLYHLNIVDSKNQTLKTIADKAMDYLNKAITEDALDYKKQKTFEDRTLGHTEIHSYYTQSYFPDRRMSAEMKSLLDNYLQLAEKQWTSKNLYEQAMIALTMYRNNKPEVAQMIIRSLNETAQHSDDMGMYWVKNQLGYYWYQSPIETQSLMIELFNETGNNLKEVEEMKIWLLRNKQTADWRTTKATASACYALLMKGDDWQVSNETSDIKLAGKSLQELKPDVKADEGTGYIKTTWTDEQVKPALGQVKIQNNGKMISWGAIHWQYLENLDKITSSNTELQLERKYFIQKQSDSGPVLTAVDAQHQPKTGDLLKVVVYLNAGRDFEYVQLKDMRPAGTEPVDVLSSFKNQDGLYYYQVTKDVATNFFISDLKKGNYVFEYSLRVAQPGNFSTGITTVQSMYAPEFNAHSEGSRLLIKAN